jgi:hypothetical protein
MGAAPGQLHVELLAAAAHVGAEQPADAVQHVWVRRQPCKGRVAVAALHPPDARRRGGVAGFEVEQGVVGRLGSDRLTVS